MENHELLSSPGGLVVFRRPEIGDAVLVNDHAEIVVRRWWVSAEEAEDFDWFDVALAGGAWQVATRPAQTDDERAKCAAVETAARERREADARKAEERRQAEQRERERAAQERADYEAWQKTALVGLVATTAYPFRDARFRIAYDELVYRVSDATGWMTTGDQWYRLYWNGQPVGLYKAYGNAGVAYVPAELAATWYQERWDKQRAEDGEDVHAVACLKHLYLYRGCYGSDYHAWVERTIGRDRLIEMAKRGVHRYEPRVNNNEELVEHLQSLGIDARLLQETGQRAPGTTGVPYPVFRDPVDGSEWIAPMYRPLQRVGRDG